MHVALSHVRHTYFMSLQSPFWSSEMLFKQQPTVSFLQQK